MRGQIALALIAIVSAAGCGATPSAPSRQPSQPAPVPTTNTQPSAPPANSPDPDPLVGSYSLDLTMDKLGPGCERVPDTVKRRTYDATIASSVASSYTVTLESGNFLSGLICDFVPSHLGCNQFTASRSGDVLRFDLANNNDDGHGGHIVEMVPQAGWFELIGSTTGAMNNNGTIASSGTASLWYCASSASYPFPCPTFVGCAVDDLRMTLVRR
jgi:hypothetical protein